VLRVDGRPIRQSAIDALRAEFRLGGTEDTEARAQEEAVRREFVRREAERLDVAVDADEVAARRRAQLVTQLGGEEALSAALAKIPITDAQLRSGLRDGVLREAVQDAKYGSIAVTAARRAPYYDKHRRGVPREASAHLEMIQVRAERIGETALRRLDEGPSLRRGRAGSSPPTRSPRPPAGTWGPSRSPPCLRPSAGRSSRPASAR